MGPLVQIGAAVVALALTAVLVLIDVRPPGKPKADPAEAERRAREKRLRRKKPKTPRFKPHTAKTPRVKQPRSRRRDRKEQVVERDAAIVDFTQALREADEAAADLPPATGSRGATALEPVPVGAPVFRPDPERLIQHEVVEPAGTAYRLGALFRLVTWVGMAGLLLAFSILGVIRGIVLLFETALG